jgi:hypothetical protein
MAPSGPLVALAWSAAPDSEIRMCRSWSCSPLGGPMTGPAPDRRRRPRTGVHATGRLTGRSGQRWGGKEARQKEPGMSCANLAGTIVMDTAATVALGREGGRHAAVGCPAGGGKNEAIPVWGKGGRLGGQAAGGRLALRLQLNLPPTFFLARPFPLPPLLFLSSPTTSSQGSEFTSQVPHQPSVKSSLGHVATHPNQLPLDNQAFPPDRRFPTIHQPP